MGPAGLAPLAGADSVVHFQFIGFPPAIRGGNSHGCGIRCPVGVAHGRGGPHYATLPPRTPSTMRRTPHSIGLILVCSSCVVFGMLTLLYYQAKPPVVTLSSRTLTIENLFYGQTYPFSEVNGVELLSSLPPIRLRTNGYAAGGTLRVGFQ